MSTAATYKVIFSGNTLTGHTPKEVAHQFSKAFNLRDQESLQQLFSGKIITLKRGLNHEQAQRYSNILQKLGADCCIEPEHNPLLDVDDFHDSDYERKKRRRVAQFRSSIPGDLSLAPM